MGESVFDNVPSFRRPPTPSAADEAVELSLHVQPGPSVLVQIMLVVGRY